MPDQGDPHRVEKTSSELVFDGFLKIYKTIFRYQTFAGPMSRPTERLVMDRGDAAAAVLWDRQAERLILAKQFRIATVEDGPGWLIELVAGAIDEGESGEDAVRREVDEETGYHADWIEKISHFYTSPGGMTERMFLFFVEADTPAIPKSGLDDEDIRTVTMTRAEARAALDQDKIQDAKTIIGLEWFLKNKS